MSFSYLTVVTAALFAFVVLAILFESWKTARKYRHLPWAGTESPRWWKLNYLRLYNFVNLKRDYDSLADKVSSRTHFIASSQ